MSLTYVKFLEISAPKQFFHEGFAQGKIYRIYTLLKENSDNFVK